MLGGIEAGGTKFVCAVGDKNGVIGERLEIPTTVPAETIPKVVEFFKRFELDSIGIGSFGPIDVNQDSSTYGYITSTPKMGWRNFPFVQAMRESFDVPIGFNTDVNAAALAEVRLGAAKGLDSCLYITVGTGIGAGAVVHGKILQGLSHPEMGHILVNRHPSDSYQGKCPYHQACLEGLAAGPAIEERWGSKGINLVDRAEVWDLEGYYLAQALMNYILLLSPQKIVMGGGVMHQQRVFSSIYNYLPELMNNYVSLPDLKDYIVAPGLGDNAGITGALLLGEHGDGSRASISRQA